MDQDVRDRLVLPILIPVGLLAVIAVCAVVFGMILLFNPLQVSLMVAIAAAGAILAAFGLATSRPEHEMTAGKRGVIALAAIAPVVVGVLVAVDVLPTTSQKVVEKKCEFCIPADAVRLVAKNLAFDPQQITLPSQGDVHILLVNQDQGVLHNLAVFPRDSRGQPVRSSPVFQGTVFAGNAQQVYTFNAPGSGAYYFQCDVHPQTMNGTVVFGQG